MEMIVKLYDGDKYSNQVYARQGDEDSARFHIEYDNDSRQVNITSFYEDPDNSNQPNRDQYGKVHNLVSYGMSLHTLNELIDALTYARQQMMDDKKEL